MRCCVQLYRASRNWRGRYFYLSGYSSILQEFAEVPQPSLPSQADFEALKRIRDDDQEPLAHRLTAIFTRGLISWGCGNRHGAVQHYRSGIELADAATQADKDARMLTVEQRPAWKNAGELIAFYRAQCVDNMAELTRAPAPAAQAASMAGFGVTQSGQPTNAVRGIAWPVQPTTQAAHEEELQRETRAVMDQSLTCAKCGLAASPGTSLLKCARRVSTAYLHLAPHVYYCCCATELEPLCAHDIGRVQRTALSSVIRNYLPFCL